MEQSKIILIIGKKGSGKTTLSEKIVRDIKKQSNKKTVYVGPFPKDFYDEFYFCFDDKTFHEISFDMLKKNNRIWVIDDFDLYKTNEWFDKFLCVIRHLNSDLIVNCRRSKNITMLLQNQVDILYTFKQTLLYDIKYLSEWTGLPREKFLTLKKFQYLKIIF